VAQYIDVQLVGDVEDELNEPIVRVENFQTLVAAVRRRAVVRRVVGLTDVGHVDGSAVNCRRIHGECDATRGRSCKR